MCRSVSKKEKLERRGLKNVGEETIAQKQKSSVKLKQTGQTESFTHKWEGDREDIVKEAQGVETQ